MLFPLLLKPPYGDLGRKGRLARAGGLWPERLFYGP